MSITNCFPLITVASAVALSLASGSAFARLTNADCQGIVAAAVTAAGLADSDFRPGVVPPKMQIACLDRTGKILASHVDPDAWVGSIDIARAKAYSAMAFSSNENALSTRTLGCAAQPDGPLFELGNSNDPATGNNSIRERGIIVFPGGLPLYKDGELVGGIGVSGDSVRLDEDVAEAGAVDFEPAPGITSEAVIGVEYVYTTATANNAAALCGVPVND
ncbi:MAG: heme-binding protein [Chromatiales bacterium]